MSLHKHQETNNMGTVIGIIIVIIIVIKHRNYRNYDNRNRSLPLAEAGHSCDRNFL